MLFNNYFCYLIIKNNHAKIFCIHPYFPKQRAQPRFFICIAIHRTLKCNFPTFKPSSNPNIHIASFQAAFIILPAIYATHTCIGYGYVSA